MGTGKFKIDGIEAKGIFVPNGKKTVEGMLKIFGTGIADDDFLAVKRGDVTFLIPISPVGIAVEPEWVTRTMISRLYNGRYEFFVVDKEEWVKHHRLAAVGNRYNITIDIPAPATSDGIIASVANITVIETGDRQPVQNGGTALSSVLIFRGDTTGTTRLALWAGLDGETPQPLVPKLEWSGSKWLTATQMLNNGTYRFMLAHHENDEPASDIYTVTVQAPRDQ